MEPALSRSQVEEMRQVLFEVVFLKEGEWLERDGLLHDWLVDNTEASSRFLENQVTLFDGLAESIALRLHVFDTALGMKRAAAAMRVRGHFEVSS